MEENNSKLISVLSKVLNLNSTDISNSISPENTSSWDSFNALVMVTELESTFNVSFTMEEVYAVRCVGDIRATLMKHGIQFDDSGS